MPVRLSYILCSLLIFTLIAPANATETWRVPICSNGKIEYIFMEFERNDEAPGNHPSACHGVCLFDRRAAVLNRKTA